MSSCRDNPTPPCVHKWVWVSAGAHHEHGVLVPPQRAVEGLEGRDVASHFNGQRQPQSPAHIHAKFSALAVAVQVSEAAPEGRQLQTSLSNMIELLNGTPLLSPSVPGTSSKRSLPVAGCTPSSPLPHGFYKHSPSFQSAMGRFKCCART